jgi:uncharacterized repeat protein (TIGR02543 family)
METGQIVINGVVHTYPWTHNGKIYQKGDPLTLGNGYIYQSVSGSDSGALNANGSTKYFLGYCTYQSNGSEVPHPVAVMNGASHSSPTSGYINWSTIASGGTNANYTVTINLNGGTAAIYEGKSFTSFPVILNTNTWYVFNGYQPTRNGYTFKGLYTADGEQIYNSDGLACGDGTYWEAYQVGDGTIGYRWIYKGNVTLYAQWQGNPYTLTINPNGGKWNGTASNSTITQNCGTTKVISNPKRDGYTFNGWDLSNDNGSLSGTTYTYGAGNCTMTASWKANPYTYNIVYKTLSGIQLGTDTATYDYGGTYPIIPKAFDGYVNPDYQNVSWNQTTPKTITFIYTPTEYSISYALNGGEVSTANKTSYNIETTTFTLNNPTREGYTFVGWTGSNGSTASKSVSITKGSTGNKTYTANWEANPYTITYKANGGNGSDVSQTVYYDTSWTTKGEIFTRLGYKLESWNTKEDGSGITYSLNTGQTNKQLSNVTLYAQWKPSGIIYIDNGNKLEPYLVYIDNGVSWDLYLAYVDNGTDWNIIS